MASAVAGAVAGAAAGAVLGAVAGAATGAVAGAMAGAVAGALAVRRPDVCLLVEVATAVATASAVAATAYELPKPGPCCSESTPLPALASTAVEVADLLLDGAAAPAVAAQPAGGLNTFAVAGRLA